MYIDFSPSLKTQAKIKRIVELRGQGMIWDNVAKELGHRVRYCKALMEYYRKNKEVHE